MHSSVLPYGYGKSFTKTVLSYTVVNWWKAIHFTENRSRTINSDRYLILYIDTSENSILQSYPGIHRREGEGGGLIVYERAFIRMYPMLFIRYMVGWHFIYIEHGHGHLIAVYVDGFTVIDCWHQQTMDTFLFWQAIWFYRFTHIFTMYAGMPAMYRHTTDHVSVPESDIISGRFSRVSVRSIDCCPQQQQQQQLEGKT